MSSARGSLIESFEAEDEMSVQSLVDCDVEFSFHLFGVDGFVHLEWLNHAVAVGFARWRWTDEIQSGDPFESVTKRNDVSLE